MTASELQTKITTAYNGLNVNTLASLDDFYSTEVEFHDPMSSMHGLDKLKGYYRNMYKNVKSIHFDIQKFIIDADHNVALTWVMTYSSDSLNGGRPIMVPGTSILKFNEDNKVYYHRDYFDNGAMVYEHIPVLGFFVRKIKEGLSVD